MTNATTRISQEADGTPGDNVSDMPVISADGQFIVFRSAATNLVNGDTNGLFDVFLYSVDTEQTVRVNVTNSGNQAQTGNIIPQRQSLSGYDPSVAVTDEGEIFVTYTSVAPNLTGDTNQTGRAHVMLRQLNDLSDLTDGSTSRITPIANGSDFENSDQSTLAADGSVVAFRSTLNLSNPDNDSLSDVFVKFPVFDPTILLDNFDDN